MHANKQIGIKMPMRSLLELRRGLSVIEVLVSIVVALIGVFGVMALIPFSVKQSQSGLDRDAVTMVAKNAHQHFEAGGYQTVTTALDGTRTLNWSLASTGTRYSPDPGGGGLLNPPMVLCIDPLGSAQSLIADPTSNESGVGLTNRFFPFNLYNANTADPMPFPVAGVGDLRIKVANLLTPSGLMSQAHAREIFRTQDDLAFGDAADSLAGDDAEFNGPTQLFDTITGGAPARRQADGRISWCGIVAPSYDAINVSQIRGNIGNPATSNVSRYRFYTLVFKNRSVDETAPIDPIEPHEGVMAVARIVRTAAGEDIAAPLSTVQLFATIPNGSVRSDDWVMLINRDIGDPQVPIGHQLQIAFARVINSTEGGLLTLDGPDFVFQNDKQVGGTVGTLGPTYIVHLKNVIGVFERSFTLESDSSWTITE